MVKTWDDDEDGGEIVDIVYHDDGGERLVRGEHWSQKPNAPKASASCVLPTSQTHNCYALPPQTILHYALL